MRLVVPVWRACQKPLLPSVKQTVSEAVFMAKGCQAPNRVIVNTLREWLGFDSLGVTLAYLKGAEAAKFV